MSRSSTSTSSSTPMGDRSARMMKVAEIAESAMAHRQSYPDHPPGYILAHGHRVAKIAVALADRLGATIDREILYTAALFHDVGKDADPHEVVGADRAASLLEPLFAPEELKHIQEIVLHHNHREHPDRYGEAVRIVQDADSLDHVGPVGAWLSSYHTATERGTLDDLLAFVRSDAEVADKAEMRRQLNFEVSRTMYDARLAYEGGVYAALTHAQEEGWT